MANKVRPIPPGYHTITPYLVVNDADKALAFYQKAFGATEVMRMNRPDGKVMHAEIKIGDSHVMLADECPEMKVKSPKTLGGSPVTMLLYVEDTDLLFNQTVAAGAKVIMAVENQFYGDRAGKVEDPFGHQWYISTHVEDVSPDEMKKRAAKKFAK